MPNDIAFDPFSMLKDWTVAEPFQEKVSIEGVDIFLSGFQAAHADLGEVVGAAAEAGSHPGNRAWYELLERITVLEAIRKAPTLFPLRDPISGAVAGETPYGEVFPQPKDENTEAQFAKSNGVALEKNWRTACRKAAFELVERHLILSTWVGKTKPEIIKEAMPQSLLARLHRQYKVVRVDFGKQSVDFLPQPVHCCGAFLFPRTPDAPLAFGFGAGLSSAEALGKAELEAIQRLGFLWGEEVPTAEPVFSPTALYHQEYYLNPNTVQLLEDWLAGKFLRSDAEHVPKTIRISFVDLSAYSVGGFFVARATCPEAIPLVFGKWREREFKYLDDRLLVHPVA